ncbi:MAG TPA: hypothetical protein DCY79_00600 [Planctomycetaceae bacterium]|nr:hypothetical protein [Blastopirellula sp.]HAY78285.1 hypothetical protein [Planctomycetaceae bacterium]
MKDLDQAFIRAFDKQVHPSIVIRGLQSTDASRTYAIDVSEIGMHTRIDAVAMQRAVADQLRPGGAEAVPGNAGTRNELASDDSSHRDYAPEAILVTSSGTTDAANCGEPAGESLDAEFTEAAQKIARFQSMHLGDDVRVDLGNVDAVRPHLASSSSKEVRHSNDLRGEGDGEAAEALRSAERPVEESRDSVGLNEFHAAWEVDQFRWPKVCDDLREHDLLAGLGSQLANANRDGLRVMAVTGKRQGEGGTTLALCLAQCAALSGLRVGLVDADFEQPNLAEQLGVAAHATWMCAMQGRVPIEEAGVYALRDGITAFPLTPSATQKGVTQLKQIADWIQEVKQYFDMIILDAGVQTSNAHQLLAVNTAEAIDAVTVVRDMRRTTDAEIEGVVRRVHATGIEAVGIVENFGDWGSESLKASA